MRSFGNILEKYSTVLGDAFFITESRCKGGLLLDIRTNVPANGGYFGVIRGSFCFLKDR